MTTAVPGATTAQKTQLHLPVPVVDEDSREFWEGCRRDRLMLQRCTVCGHHRYPPRPMCPECGAFDVTWVECSGRGTVYSWLIVRHPVHPAIVDKVPYPLVLVQLHEGPRIVSILVGAAPEEVRAGLEVGVVFDHSNPEVTIPKFALTSK